MKIGIKTIIVTILIIAISTSWYLWDKNNKAKLEAEKIAKMAYTVKKGDIKTEVKVTATAKLANEQNLSFGQEGKITKVYVKVGDEIKAGKILAELSMDDYQNAVHTSELELENAKLGLKKLLNNDTSLRETQIKSQINEIKANYDVEIEQEKVLKKQLETSISQKKENLDQLIRDYGIDKKNLETAKYGLTVNTNVETEQTESSLVARKQTIDSIVNSLKLSLSDLKTVVESVDKIYGVSTEFENGNNSFENYLGVKDNNLKNKTKSEVTDGYNLINKYTEQFKNINSDTITDDEITSLIKNYYNDTIILVTLCDDAIDSIDKSIEALGSLSITMIEGFKNTVNVSRTSVIGIRKQLETYNSSINSLLSDTSKKEQLNVSIDQKNIDYNKKETSLKKLGEQILSLTKEIETSQIDNETQLNRKNTQNKTMLDKIEVLKKELNDLLDGADEYDIQQAKNMINQAELRLTRTKDQKDNYQIIAEFDGRVRTVDIVEGEQYKLTDKKYIVIENPNLIELELQVSQIDVVKIKEKDPVVVTFDAYPYTPIVAKISNRNVNPEPNSRGGFYYKATILLNKQELEILAGMTAIVNIETEKAENVIVIPSLSIVQEGDKKYVYKKEGELYKKHEIKTGTTNNFQAEVKEGLKENDIIKISALDDETLKEMGIDESSSNIFGG